MKTPHEHAVSRGYYKGKNPLLPQNEAFYFWKHACADRLHGWANDAHHYSTDPFKLSDDDYELALTAAAEYPNTPAYEPAIPVRENG